MDRFSRANFLIDFPDQIKQARVHFGGFVATPIAQKMVELGEAFFLS